MRRPVLFYHRSGTVPMMKQRRDAARKIYSANMRKEEQYGHNEHLA